MAQWVSVTDAARLLTEGGDVISQPGLSLYLGRHPEVATRDQGEGRPKLIDYQALKLSRQTRRGRGPSSTGPAPEDGQLPLAVEAPDEPPATGDADARSGRREPAADSLAGRKARADTEAAEFGARRARVLAMEAEGRVIDRDVAVNAFRAAGVELNRVLEEDRRRAVDAIRVAKDSREADLAYKHHQDRVRAALATALTGIAAAADPALAQAAE